jgi:hypothetical protein
MATYLEAPENVAQPGEMYPEAIAYLDLVKDHPMFLRPQRHAIASGTDSPVTESTEDEQENNTPGDPEDKTFRSRMTSKGVFKSRNVQRQEELKKKRKGSPNEIVIDLTKEKQIKAAERHSIAAKTHAEGVKCQSQIAAIEQAMKMGISADVLRPFMMKTLHTLLDTDTHNEDDDDDSEEVQFVSSIKRNNSKGKTIKSELTLPSSVSSAPVASSRHDNTVRTNVGKNEQCGQCCAEDECVCSDDELDGYDCLQCVNCDRPCHSFCVQPFDDNDPGSNRYLCFKCVLNSPSAAADA